MSADETYWLCVTRTVQELKLFPVPAYMMLCYIMVYFQYPSLLRKIELRMSAEEIGDRARQSGIQDLKSLHGLGAAGLLSSGA